MYAALGVDNIESLLVPPADTTPQPVDAGIENSGLLQGIPQQAFPEQNHEAHVEAHKSLFLTQAVIMNPQLQSVIIAHVMQHLQFLANQLAQEQMPPELIQQIEQLSVESAQLEPEQQQAVALPELARMIDATARSLRRGERLARRSSARPRARRRRRLRPRASGADTPGGSGWTPPCARPGFGEMLGTFLVRARKSTRVREGDLS